MPVFSRPPCVKISQRSVSKLVRRLGDEIRVFHGRRVDRNLVGSREQQLSYVGDLAHAAADCQRHEALLGGAGDDVEDRLAVFRRSGDVEETELVGAGRIIGLGRLDRIAGIDQIDEVDALDDTAVLDVEAWDDAGFEGHAGRSKRPA
jgi:hypothetical protein